MQYLSDTCKDDAAQSGTDSNVLIRSEWGVASAAVDGLLLNCDSIWTGKQNHSLASENDRAV